MITGILLFLLVISITLNGFLYRENLKLKQVKRRDDYYISVDEENDRLRKLHGEK